MISKTAKLMLIIFTIFLVWMIFFDENSYINRNRLNKDIKTLKTETNFYKTETKKDQKIISDLNNTDSLEKYAREKYQMKKENEAIFLIEFDTIK